MTTLFNTKKTPTAFAIAGTENAPTKIGNAEFNKSGDNAVASYVDHGTAQQPNLVAWQNGFKRFDDITGGNQSAFVYDPNFDVKIFENNLRVTYRMSLINRSDGGNTPLLDSQFSVTKSGTELTFTTNDPVNMADKIVQVMVIGEAQDGDDSVILNFISHCYDSVTDSSGPQVSIFATHSRSINNPGGHLTLGFGSYLYAVDGCSYMWIGGTNILATDYDTSFAIGQNLTVGGAACFVAGYNIDCDMDNVLVSGMDHKIRTGNRLDYRHGVFLGRGAVPRIASCILFGMNDSNSTQPACSQYGIYGRRKTSFSSSQAILRPNAGSALFIMGSNTIVGAMVKVIASKSDGSAFADFVGHVLFRKIGANVTRAGTGNLELVNSFGDVAGIAVNCVNAGAGFYTRFYGRDAEQWNATSVEIKVEHRYDLTQS